MGMTKDLLPCPFCGDAGLRRGTYACCDTCELEMPIVIWNRRAPAAVPREPNDAEDAGLVVVLRPPRDILFRGVPREPTEAMLRAGIAAWLQSLTIGGVGPRLNEAWRAMWDAAQEAGK